MAKRKEKTEKTIKKEVLKEILRIPIEARKSTKKIKSKKEYNRHINKLKINKILKGEIEDFDIY